VPAASPGATPQSPAQAAAPGVTLDPVTNKPTGMLTTGSNAPAGADRRYGDFFASPDYAFRRDESLRAITGNAQAKGLIDSGALGKGLIDYAGKAASQEFGSWFDRLATLAGYGTTATAGTAAAGAHAADNVSGIIQNQGENLASSITARGGVNAGLITNAAGAAGGLISNIGGAGGGARSVGTIADAFTGGGLAPLPGYVNGLINNLPQPGLFA
jgi:hypothetical protein